MPRNFIMLRIITSNILLKILQAIVVLAEPACLFQQTADETDGCTFHYRFRVSLDGSFSRAVGHLQPLAGEQIEPGKLHYSS